MSHVLLSGLDEIFNLAEERKTLFVRHVMKKSNWSDSGKALKVPESSGRCACSASLTRKVLKVKVPQRREGREWVQFSAVPAFQLHLAFFILFMLIASEIASKRPEGQLIPISKVEDPSVQ